MKKIKLTEEEVKTFYKHVANEEAARELCKPENMVGIEPDQLDAYLDKASEKLSDVLYESNVFIRELRKRYDVDNFEVVDDYIIEH